MQNEFKQNKFKWMSRTMTVRAGMAWKIRGRRHDQSPLIFEVPRTIADAATLPAIAAPGTVHQYSPPIERKENSQVKDAVNLPRHCGGAISAT